MLARQATELVRATEGLEQRDKEFGEALEQAEKYRETLKRAEELGRINEELKAEVERRTKAEEEIRASLQEKEVLLKEVHHRVKNNLQIISSLLNLQASRQNDENLNSMFDESQARIRSMALIHEQLYQSDDLATVDFKDYLTTLVASLFRTFGRHAGRVRSELAIEPISLGLDTAIPLGLIVNELISNALKYAFPEGAAGTISLKVKHDSSGQIRLSISDDGVGLPDSVDESSSLGLRLVGTLCQQLGTQLEISRHHTTCFTVVAGRSENRIASYEIVEGG